MRREPEKIRLGVSSCLLAHAVRYDGGHERDAFLVEAYGIQLAATLTPSPRSR